MSSTLDGRYAAHADRAGRVSSLGGELEQARSRSRRTLSARPGPRRSTGRSARRRSTSARSRSASCVRFARARSASPRARRAIGSPRRVGARGELVDRGASRGSGRGSAPAERGRAAESRVAMDSKVDTELACKRTASRLTLPAHKGCCEGRPGSRPRSGSRCPDRCGSAAALPALGSILRRRLAMWTRSTWVSSW